MGNIVIQKTRTKPVEIEYVKYSNLADVHQISDWITRVENVEVAMREPGCPVTIAYLVPGPFGTTNELTFKFGDYIIKDLDGRFRVYNDRGFRQYFED
ncbi:MAG: hypothetical protein IPM04_13405 [Saprospiraceae bacterium]|nr:hypothetical protein [Candidatus Brachybacter algidus]MBK8748815.1 hypothetical protein [Candidatus Brachybacter algidus]